VSERGSFCTEYIYCAKCFEAAKSVLLKREKYICSTMIPTWEQSGGDLPIIAGKVGGVYAGEELVTFDQTYTEALAKVICHPMRIAVIAEVGQRFFEIQPEVTK